ncbi:MAG TPA: glycosyltransferase [Bacteroidales bacterium]|nr:glycosyltransferase [Bacteroidales bacterium]
MSKLKIYKAFHAYQSYLDQFYKQNPQLKYSSFIDQRNALIYDGAPWIFSWSTNNSNNDIEIFETVHNAEFLQKASIDKCSQEIDWQIKIVFEQIKEMQPDICVLYPPNIFDKERIDAIRSLVKHEIFVVGYDGMNRENIKLYNGYDLIITCSDYISSFYNKNGIPSYTLKFGFDDSILKRINLNSKLKFNIGFTGSIYHNVHDGRYEFLRELTKKNHIAIRSDFLLEENMNLFSKNQLKRLIKNRDWENYLGLWRISKNNYGPVYGLEMYQFLRDTKISLNMHGDKINFAANVRLFEITGTGSCMLTDWKENLGEIFEIDKEIVTYTSVDEANDKIKFLLKNETVRKKIALKGQQRTLNEYTYKKIIPELLKFLQKSI